MPLTNPVVHTKSPQSHDIGGSQKYGPLLGPLNTRCRIKVGTKKGTIILTTTHIVAPARPSFGPPGKQTPFLIHGSSVQIQHPVPTAVLLVMSKDMDLIEYRLEEGGQKHNPYAETYGQPKCGPAILDGNSDEWCAGLKYNVRYAIFDSARVCSEVTILERHI